MFPFTRVPFGVPIFDPQPCYERHLWGKRQQFQVLGNQRRCCPSSEKIEPCSLAPGIWYPATKAGFLLVSLSKPNQGGPFGEYQQGFFDVPSSLPTSGNRVG